MSKPLISIIIPTHNNADTVGDAIRSMLGQTYPNIEIIVVDDFSTDATEGTVRAFMQHHSNIRYLKVLQDDPKRFGKNGRNINAGYQARNVGLDASQGEWITFQDADDASLLNRIQVQYDLAQKYGADHVCIQWQQLHPALLGKKLDVDAYLKVHANGLITSKEDIRLLSQRSKGIVPKLLGDWHRHIPFELKTARKIHRLFFGSPDSYPGSGNCPLFKKTHTDKVRFRQRDDRVWPSYTGRGADRDFNFQIAETFGNSMTFHIPLYLYRSPRQNYGFDGAERFVVEQ